MSDFNEEYIGIFGKEKKIKVGSKVNLNDDSISKRKDIENDMKSIDMKYISKNNSVVKRRRRLSNGEATTNLTIRAPLSVSNRFIAFADNIRATSYWDALNIMMNLLNIDEDGNVQK